MRWTYQLGTYGLDGFKREARADGPAFPVFLRSINKLEFGDRIDVVSPDGLGGYFRVVGIGVDARMFMELTPLVDSVAIAELNRASHRKSGVYGLGRSVVVKDALAAIVPMIDRVCQEMDVCPIVTIHGTTLSKPNGETAPSTLGQGFHGPIDGDRTQVRGQIVPLIDWNPAREWVIGLPEGTLPKIKREVLSFGQEVIQTMERLSSERSPVTPVVECREERSRTRAPVYLEPRNAWTRSSTPPQPRLAELVTWPLDGDNSPGGVYVSLPGRSISLRMEEVTDITINDPSD
jgi:hypothetical protein